MYVSAQGSTIWADIDDLPELLNQIYEDKVKPESIEIFENFLKWCSPMIDTGLQKNVMIREAIASHATFWDTDDKIRFITNMHKLIKGTHVESQFINLMDVLYDDWSSKVEGDPVLKAVKNYKNKGKLYNKSTTICAFAHNCFKHY